MINLKIGFSADELEAEYPIGAEILKTRRSELGGIKHKKAAVEVLTRSGQVKQIKGDLVYYSWIVGGLNWSKTSWGERPERGIVIHEVLNTGNGAHVFFVPDDSTVESRLEKLPTYPNLLALDMSHDPLVIEIKNNHQNRPPMETYNLTAELLKTFSLQGHKVFEDLMDLRLRKIEGYVKWQGYAVTAGRTKWFFVQQADGSVVFGNDELHKTKEKRVCGSVDDFYQTIIAESDYSAIADINKENKRVMDRINYILDTYNPLKYSKSRA
ncbi:hypothetical protein [Paenibacillus campinasensis]|uniref:Uncharacterized protein n=1 Tax=Paenibacillus campinasensis TaxID=66347 RepID=A0A268EIC4_9BACL|nr:hypothetical protein [Paenibacillus campinasensis]PAD72866.1 hypothetical protein CHH67_21405 [Paenibacillus campinasensis]